MQDSESTVAVQLNEAVPRARTVFDSTQSNEFKKVLTDKVLPVFAHVASLIIGGLIVLAFIRIIA